MSTVPDWLQAPLAAVLRDLMQPSPVTLDVVRWEPPIGEEGFGTLWFEEPGGAIGSMFGVSVVTHVDPAYLTCALADQLSDELVETYAGWGEARPRCPGHGHPAAADVVDNAAVWRCPADGRVLGRVGALGAGGDAS